MERQLDAAGRPVGDVRIVTTIEPRYDERGRVVGEWITNPRQGQAGEPAMIPLRRVEYFGADDASGPLRPAGDSVAAAAAEPRAEPGVPGDRAGRAAAHWT